MKPTDKIDERTLVRKGVRGHLLNSNPNKAWPEILVDLLAKYGTIKAVAQEIGVGEQVVHEWVSHETKVTGAIKKKRQPPVVWLKPLCKSPMSVRPNREIVKL